MKRNQKKGSKKSKGNSQAVEPTPGCTDDDKAMSSPVKKKARLSRKKSKDEEPLSESSSTRTREDLEPKKLIPTFGKKKPTVSSVANTTMSPPHQDQPSEESNAETDGMEAEKQHPVSDAIMEDGEVALNVALKDTDNEHKEVNMENADTNLEQVDQGDVSDGQRSSNTDITYDKNNAPSVTDGRSLSNSVVASDECVKPVLKTGDTAESEAKALANRADVIDHSEADSDQENKSVQSKVQGGTEGQESDEISNKFPITQAPESDDGAHTLQSAGQIEDQDTNTKNVLLLQMLGTIVCQMGEGSDETVPGKGVENDHQCTDNGANLVAITSTSEKTCKISPPVPSPTNMHADIENMGKRATDNEDQDNKMTVELNVPEEDKPGKEVADMVLEERTSPDQMPKISTSDMDKQSQTKDERKADINGKSFMDLSYMDKQSQTKDERKADDISGKSIMDLEDGLKEIKAVDMEVKPQPIGAGSKKAKEIREIEMEVEPPTMEEPNDGEDNMKIPEASDDGDKSKGEICLVGAAEKSESQSVVSERPAQMQGSLCDDEGAANKPDCVDVLDDDMMDFTFSQVCHMEELCLRNAAPGWNASHQKQTTAPKLNAVPQSSSTTDLPSKYNTATTGPSSLASNKTSPYGSNVSAGPSSLASDKSSPYGSNISVFKPMCLPPGPSYTLRTEDREAAKVVQGVIDELKGLNQMIMGAKKQIETARRQRQQKQQQQQFRQHNATPIRPRQQGYQQQKPHQNVYIDGKKKTFHAEQ